MLSHVLIAVDGSPASYFAARQGLSLARQTKAKATLCFVLEPPAVLPVGPLSGYVMTAPPRTEADVQKATAELRELTREWPDVTCDTRVELGSPAETICSVASHLGVDAIVIGARGMSQGAKWLVGAVSDRVVHHAPCPVMVVRERATR